MKKLLTLLLALCLLTGCALADTPATPTDLEPTPEPTVEATAEPTQEPTAEPTASPGTDNTPEPTTEATSEPTQKPSVTPEGDNTPEPATTPAEPASSPDDGPLYVLVDGAKVYGAPDALIPMGLTVYLYDATVVEITGYTAEELAQVKFALDPEAFTAKDDCIYLSVRDPNGFVKQDTFFLWAGKTGDMVTPTPALGNKGEVVEHEILVTALDYSADEPCRPSFRLAAAPSPEQGMSFAVIIGEGDPQLLSGSSYTPAASGTYRFALLAADGTVLHRSAMYTVVIPQPTATPTPKPTPTAEPTATPTAVPTPTAAPAEMPELAAPDAGFAQAWTLAGDMRAEGDLADMLQTDGSTIYILTDRIIVLDSGNIQLSGKTLLPDPDVFGDGYVVRISGENEDVTRSESLFVWVEPKGKTTAVSAALTVTPDAYTPRQWASIVPSFTLSSSPVLSELGEGYAYAVSINTGAPVTLTDSTYPATEEGRYSLRFLLLAPDGRTIARSEVYTVWLDYTAPLLQAKTGNGTLQITVGDALSGGASVSLDSGTTWNALKRGEDGVSTYTHTVTGTQTFPVGSIIVRDKAGALTFYPEEITVKKISSGGRGGSGRSTSHAASTVETVTAYDGVELILDDGSMTQLTLGEEVLELSLAYTGPKALEEDEQPAFTAVFSDLSKDGIPDALTLAAAGVTDETAGDFRWTFSGLVCKKLSASGIEHLILRAGEQVTLLPTAGFTAGLRYNMYRADGLVSKDFSYALSMHAEEGLTLLVTVEETTYPMSDVPTAEFYYYDLFSGDTETFERDVLPLLEVR